MKRGQAPQHIFSDTLPAIVLLFIGLGLLYLVQAPLNQEYDNLLGQRTFDLEYNALLTSFMQSTATYAPTHTRYYQLSQETYDFYLKDANYTYGDLLYLSHLYPEQRELYLAYFQRNFIQHVHKLYPDLVWNYHILYPDDYQHFFGTATQALPVSKAQFVHEFILPLPDKERIVFSFRSVVDA